MDPQSLRDEVLKVYQHGPEAVVELVATLLAELGTQLAHGSARLAILEAENAALRAQLGTTSHNSSKPPSSDGPGVKPHPKSQRGASGRKPGGQPGHVGHTLRLVDAPDEVQVHSPSHCPTCGDRLADVPVTHRERRQSLP